ncbi:MAG TPA: glycosyltransferase [Chitinophagaceae bacterium]|nr:glycosyltransferase [Chitinophagaceae bacterium]
MIDTTDDITPLISVCIPAYKNVPFLRRLLDSLRRQTFANFEIIITDDSPDDRILDFLAAYSIEQPVSYYKNPAPLGTPANWNEAISRAKGTWIKLMHDDDWMASDRALDLFVQEVKQNPAASFIFCAFNNVFSPDGRVEKSGVSPRKLRRLKKAPAELLAGNIIGPPSVTLCKKDIALLYDTRLKWLVDIEYYLRVLKQHEFAFIDKPLVNIGVSGEQVTKYSFGIKEVELPEYLHVLEIHGMILLKNIRVYDAYWRMLRNLNVGEADIVSWQKKYPGENVLVSMTRWQKKMPARLLRMGIVSKVIMTLHFILHRSRLKMVPGK